MSPVYGDLSGFPPAILLSGTRDLFLSNTVRVHQKLLLAGSVAELLVFEGQSHAQYALVPDAPETAAAWIEVSAFFDRHLVSEWPNQRITVNVRSEGQEWKEGPKHAAFCCTFFGQGSAFG